MSGAGRIGKAGEDMGNDDKCIEHKIRIDTLTTGFLDQKTLLERVVNELSHLSSLQVGNEIKIMQMLRDIETHCAKATKILEGNGEPGLIKDNVKIKERLGVQTDKLEMLTANLKWVAVLLVTTIVGIMVEHFLK